MIIEELHYELRRRWDAMNTFHKRQLLPVEIDNVLNQATIDLILENSYGSVMRTAKGLGRFDIEYDRKRADIIQPYIVSYPEQSELTPSEIETGVFKVELKNPPLIKEYLSLIRAEAVVTVCNVKKLFNIQIEKHSDGGFNLEDFHEKPSLKWNRALGFIRDYNLYVHTGGEFTPQAIRVVYIRKPARVCIGNYPSIPTVDLPNPPNKPKVESDLPDIYHDMLIDKAIQILRLDFGEGQLNADIAISETKF